MPLKIIYIMAGGSIGALLRYAMVSLMEKLSSGNLPLGTLSVNLIGSLIVGLLWPYFEKPSENQALYLFVMFGILGAFTTFSSFSVENIQLIRDGNSKMALLYILISNVGGISLAYLGICLSKLLSRA